MAPAVERVVTRPLELRREAHAEEGANTASDHLRILVETHAEVEALRRLALVLEKFKSNLSPIESEINFL
ncbi:MAG: hypothetical protein ABSC51_01190 [Gaiellaceae bacterium]